jgi:hypothetical protein
VEPPKCTELPYQTIDELQQAVAGLIGSANCSLPRVVAQIEPPVLQARTLTDLPPVRRRALEQLVALSAGRFFRQNGAPLVSAAVWVRGDPPGAPVARAVAVELPVALAVVAGVGESSAILADIVPVPDAAPPLSLLPPGERRLREARWRRRMIAGVIAVLTIWVICLGGAWLWLRAGNETLAARLEGLREPVGALQHARASLDSAAAMLAALERTDRERGAMAERLVALIAALPDSAVLTELRLASDGEGRITGQARRAARIGLVLSGAGGIARVRLSVQGTGDSTQGAAWDQFTASVVVLGP